MGYLMKKIVFILGFILVVSIVEGQQFKIYNTQKDYSDKLIEINLKYGYPSKEYSKILNGKRIYFVCDTVVTRTYANEIPKLTEQGKYVFPVLDYVKKEFIQIELTDYNKEWYKGEIFELK